MEKETATGAAGADRESQARAHDKRIARTALIGCLVITLFYAVVETWVLARHEGSGVVVRVEQPWRITYAVFESGEKLSLPRIVANRVHPGDHVEKVRGSWVYRVGNEQINTLWYGLTSGILFLGFGVFGYFAILFMAPRSSERRNALPPSPGRGRRV